MTRATRAFPHGAGPHGREGRTPLSHRRLREAFYLLQRAFAGQHAVGRSAPQAALDKPEKPRVDLCGTMQPDGPSRYTALSSDVRNRARGFVVGGLAATRTRTARDVLEHALKYAASRSDSGMSARTIALGPGRTCGNGTICNWRRACAPTPLPGRPLAARQLAREHLRRGLAPGSFRSVDRTRHLRILEQLNGTGSLLVHLRPLPWIVTKSASCHTPEREDGPPVEPRWQPERAFFATKRSRATRIRRADPYGCSGRDRTVDVELVGDLDEHVAAVVVDQPIGRAAHARSIAAVSFNTSSCPV